jgi:SAM-dependent methyltransferase
VRCKNCGFVYVNPRPTSEELKDFYQNPSYYKGGGGTDYGYPNYLEEKETYENQSRERLSIIERFIRPARLLDLGCAAGFFLKEAQERGWIIEGIEFSKPMAQFAEGIIRQKIHESLAGSSLQPGSFDVVTMWDYIEHQFDPRETLLTVNRLLRPGGLVSISTPNTENFEAKTEADEWYEFRPPEHINFFTSTTLGLLLQSCGFAPRLVQGRDRLRNSVPPRIRSFLRRCIQLLGYRQNKITPVWWISSGLRILIEGVINTYYRVRPRKQHIDLFSTLEIYAERIQDVSK